MNGKMKFIGGVDFDELRAQRVKVYDTLTIDLATVRADQEMIISGNYIYALEATDITTTLQVKLNEIPRSLISLYKGRGVRAPFYRLYLTNAAQAGKTITLAIGIESDTFEVFDVGKALELSGYVKVDGTDGACTYGQPAIAVSPTIIKAANSKRKRIHIINIGTTGLILYLGDASVATNTGFPIYPVVDTPALSRITLHHKGAIYMACSGGGQAAYFEENYL